MKKLIRLILGLTLLLSMTSCGSSSKTIDRETLDEIMSLYYFDSYEFKSVSYDEETDRTVAEYDVTYSSKHLNYDGGIHLYCSSVYEDEEEAEGLSVEDAYEWTIDYDDDLQFDLSGVWNVEAKDLRSSNSSWNVRSGLRSVSVEFSDINSADQTVTLRGSEVVYFWESYQTNDKSAKTDFMTVSYDIDYTNSEFHFSKFMYSAEPDYLREISYKPPTMYFSFDIKNCSCEMKVKPDDIEINVLFGGNGNTGSMHQ